MTDRPILKEQSWEAFRSAGMVWLANRILHLFGWALVFELDEGEDGEAQEVLRVYPARCRFRGFCGEVEGEGFKKVTQFAKDHADELIEDCEMGDDPQAPGIVDTEDST